MLRENWDIHYTDWGIANRFSGNTIQLNKALRKKRWYKLHDSILKHEMEHSPGWGLQDLYLDLKPFPDKKDYRLFILTHPSSWVQFIPLWRFKGQWYLDPTLCIFYTASIAFIGGCLWLINLLQ